MKLTLEFNFDPCPETIKNVEDNLRGLLSGEGLTPIINDVIEAQEETDKPIDFKMHFYIKK